MSKTEYFMDPIAYTRLLFDPAVVVQSVRDLNGKMMLVSYKSRNEYLEPLPFSNVVIGAYTTAQARMRLYSFMEQLRPEQIAYMDTGNEHNGLSLDKLIYCLDSLFYIRRNGDDNYIKTSEYLGEMDDELVGEYGSESYITEFVSAGPKNYAFKVYLTDSGY